MKKYHKKIVFNKFFSSLGEIPDLECLEERKAKKIQKLIKLINILLIGYVTEETLKVPEEDWIWLGKALEANPYNYNYGTEKNEYSTIWEVFFKNEINRSLLNHIHQELEKVKTKTDIDINYI